MNWVIQAFPELQNLSPFKQGGQKWVFAAAHKVDGDVVLKIIYPNQNPEAVRREILAVQRVQSPRVPRILDTGQVNTPVGVCVWFREQKIAGVTLRERLQHGPLSVAEIFKLSLQMLEALSLAEQANIVHRDVKPENIIMDSNGDFWLIDFGIARHLTMSPLTTPTNPFGKFTLGYAPQEQFRNLQSDIDARADLFALGVTLHECATGTQPFLTGASTPAEIIRRVENDVLPALRLPCKASDSFRDLINAMTQKRRDHRPTTVADGLAWMQDVIKEEGLVL